jgi:hypothetical protein
MYFVGYIFGLIAEDICLFFVSGTPKKMKRMEYPLSA